MQNLAVSLGCLILSSTCLAQTTTWVQVKTKNSPPARWAQGMTYDFSRGRTVLFGGALVAGPRLNDTWEYDGKNWTQMQPKTVPPVRYLHPMVFDLARGRTVMFGGGSAGPNINDTWEWDGKDWTQRIPKNSPPSRHRAAMAYDSARQRTVLFGGGTRTSYLNDTWEWDGKNWTQITTKNAPSARMGHGMAYDSARKRIVLFGVRTGLTIWNDTWEYDGKNWVEIKIKPSTRPTRRHWHGMAYDTARRRTLMFGGASGLLAETWEYDGKNWTKMSPLTQPKQRWNNKLMVYDFGRARMVLFGGLAWNQRVPLTDTWEYVTPQNLTGSPSTISIATGGQHRLALNAGKPNALRLYWIFGSITGTSPGVTLASSVGSVHIPLNPDFYTDITIGFANTSLLFQFRGTLGLSGKANAWINVPKINNQGAIGVKLYHAALVYDANSNFYMTTKPVTLTLVK